MAKRIETLQAYSCRNDNANQDAPQWQFIRVSPTSLQFIGDSLDKVFQQYEEQALTNILLSNFIYSDKLSEPDQFYVRPVIEVLFFDHPKMFYELVLALRASDNIELFNEFENCLKNSDLVPADLFAWNAEMKFKLEQDRLMLDQHAEKLNREGSKKAACLSHISAGLYKLLSPEFVPALDGEMTPQKKLQILDFKCTCLILLNENNGSLAEVRGYKKIVANITSALFLFIPNVLNYMLTGNFFFANKTASQQLIEKTSEHTHIARNVKFRS
jgi:hypothetical protein